jgi:HEAT repeat protein
MNRSAITFLGVILFFFVITTYGFDKSSIQNTETKEAAITNLMIGLHSNNFGLRTSCAYMLGEIRAEQAVIPLMKMLRTEKNEDARIVAALSLYKINDSRGIFAVKQAIKFDDSERVRKLCFNFYNQTLRNRYGLTEQSYDNSEVALK